MALRLSINIGFVTNSSSVVHHFPKELLNDPTVKAFIEAFELSRGFVGEDLWHRGACGTFAVTKEQKAEVQAKLQSINEGRDADDYTVNVPGIAMDDDSVVLIYGDEYSSIASSLSGLMMEAAKKLGMENAIGGGVDYN